MGRRKGTRRGAKQWNNSKNTGEDFRLSAVGSCNRKQTPTMFAGPAGVAPGVCTVLAPLDSSWVTRARSCTNRCCQVLKDLLQRPTNHRELHSVHHLGSACKSQRSRSAGINACSLMTKGGQDRLKRLFKMVCSLTSTNRRHLMHGHGIAYKHQKLQQHN